MAAFSFNFNLEHDVTASSSVSRPSSRSKTPSQSPRQSCQRLRTCPSILSTTFSTVPVGKVTFHIVNTNDANFRARTGTMNSILSTVDIQAGVYEGGFKLWECALDLVTFLEQRLETMPSTVLELGCGHGLPGICALQRGAEKVTFSDYNKEVLEWTTSHNVRKNVDDQTFRKAEFYAGAWRNMSTYMEQVEHRKATEMQYDLILTAETIYTEAVAMELYETIKRHLRRTRHARAIVAAKKYYFGTNGSVQHFVGLVRAEGLFTAEIVARECDGRSNIREIVQLTYARDTLQ
ncbi:hypothetical protein PsorP6_016757 [Peronosclerospora sorghi]|uniref:Uncharacterized protein n=1 Tax=Peronosclerospora sorghi TaxID=230839 RepID=A0ACC0WD92_9STRA|nr:hypothetical protein PsorP6_016757 [Peronosclerospora sorghi]